VTNEDVTNEDEKEKEEESILDMNEKLEELLQDSPPKQRKVLQICLDALICLHEKNDLCSDSEQKCINNLREEESGIEPESYFSSSPDKRIEILQCTTESFLCNLKDKDECKTKLKSCFDTSTLLKGEVELATTSAPQTTTSESITTSKPTTITITTVRVPVTVAKESVQSGGETTVMSGSTNLDLDFTTTSFHNFDLEITTIRSSGINSTSETPSLQRVEGTEADREENFPTSTSSKTLIVDATTTMEVDKIPQTATQTTFTALPITTTSISAINITENLSKVMAMVREFEEIPQNSFTKENDVVKACLDALLCLNAINEVPSCLADELNCVQKINEKERVIDIETFFLSAKENKVNTLQCYTNAQICNLKQNLDCPINLDECLKENISVETTTEFFTSTSSVAQTETISLAEIIAKFETTTLIAESDINISSSVPDTIRIIQPVDTTETPGSIDPATLSTTEPSSTKESVSADDATESKEAITKGNNIESEQSSTNTPIKPEVGVQTTTQKITSNASTVPPFDSETTINSILDSDSAAAKEGPDFNEGNQTENPNSSTLINSLKDFTSLLPTQTEITKSTNIPSTENPEILSNPSDNETVEIQTETAKLPQPSEEFNNKQETNESETENEFNKKSGIVDTPNQSQKDEGTKENSSSSTEAVLTDGVKNLNNADSIDFGTTTEKLQISFETTSVISNEPVSIFSESNKGSFSPTTENNREPEVTTTEIIQQSSTPNSLDKMPLVFQSSKNQNLTNDISGDDQSNLSSKKPFTIEETENVEEKSKDESSVTESSNTDTATNEGVDHSATTTLKTKISENTVEQQTISSEILRAEETTTHQNSINEVSTKEETVTRNAIEKTSIPTELNDIAQVTTQSISKDDESILEITTLNFDNISSRAEENLGESVEEESKTSASPISEAVTSPEENITIEPKTANESKEDENFSVSTIEKPDSFKDTSTERNKAPDTTESVSQAPTTPINESDFKSNEITTENQSNQSDLNRKPNVSETISSTNDTVDILPSIRSNINSKFNVGLTNLDTQFTTSTTHPVTSIIDFLTTFETPHLSTVGTSLDVSFYNSTAKTSFRLAMCLDGVHCKEDSPRCSIIHKECNEGLNVAQLPFQVKKKLSECTVDDILCHLDGKEPPAFCKTMYEKCVNIVIPESLIPTVSLMETEIAPIRPVEDNTDMNPFFTLLALSKLSGGLKENESKFLENITSSVLEAVSNSVGGIEILKLNSTDEIQEWLNDKDTLPIFHDLTVIIPDEGENSTNLVNPEMVDFDLSNSSLIFDPSSLVIGNTNAKDAQILAKDIINALSDKVHICHAPECEQDEDYGGGITASNETELIDFSDDFEDKTVTEKINFQGIPANSSFFEIQMHLSNCLEGVSCSEINRCTTAQEQCLGKENAVKFSTKDKKHLSECVVDYYLCSLDTSGNKSSCQINVDSCLTMVIILKDASSADLITSTQRSFPTTNPAFELEIDSKQPQATISDLIESIAKNITLLVENEDREANTKITIQVKNDVAEDEQLNGSIILDKEEDTNTITLVSLNPQVQFKPSDSNQIEIDTSDLVNENPSDRQKIAQQRIENVLRQITTDFQFGPNSTLKPEEIGITSRINPAITMSASTAFMEDSIFNATESTPLSFTQQSIDTSVENHTKEDFVLDFDVTVEDHNLLEVISAAVSSYTTQSTALPKDIIFTIQKTENASDPMIMIQMSEFSNNTIVNIKISNDSITPSIIFVPLQDIIYNKEENETIIDENKLTSILEGRLFSTEDSNPVVLKPEEIAEVLSTLVDANDEKKIEVLISNKTVKALINENIYEFTSSESFPHEEKINLDLSEMPMSPSDVFLNNEVKDIIYRQFLLNLKTTEMSTDDAKKGSEFQLEVPTLGINISSQNISNNNTLPSQELGEDSPEGVFAQSTILETTPSKEIGENIMSFPMFGFNITSGNTTPLNESTISSSSSKNELVEWEGKKSLD